MPSVLKMIQNNITMPSVLKMIQNNVAMLVLYLPELPEFIYRHESRRVETYDNTLQGCALSETLVISQNHGMSDAGALWNREDHSILL